MPSPETEAQIEGATNLWRYHVRGWVPLWVGLGGIAAVGLALAGLTHLLASHPAQICNTVAQCNRYILSHPLHVKGFPTYTP